MKKITTKDCFFVWATSVFYGALVIPIDFFISIKSGAIGFVPSVLLAFRASVLIMFLLIIFNGFLYLIFLQLNTAKPHTVSGLIQKSAFVGSGIFVILFFVFFDRFYNKFQALLVTEIAGGTIALLVTWIFYLFYRSETRVQRLTAALPKISMIGTLVIIILAIISFLGPEDNRKNSKRRHEVVQPGSPNILLIVLDTVRADHLSLYGYNRKTTPFLENFAKESTVFNNAYAASPWTLPSHASIFTGLYPSQHNTHAEHMWLDNSYRTLAEMLYDKGYQTINFTNNSYITSYHNLTKGFERVWHKGFWNDEMKMVKPSVGGSVVSSFNWLWKEIQTKVLVKIIKNPASVLDTSYSAELTNKDISEWLDNEWDDRRPFFVFINYMDAHFPYNPDDETARLFLNDDELKISYRQELRFPPIEFILDLSKGGYTQADIKIIGSLYDACIRYLDGELEKLFKKLKNKRILDETLIIITSDHGEYLGTRNRLAHGLGLHDEVLHVPLIIRHPGFFEPGGRYDSAVTHIDITETILSVAKIENRPKLEPETQLLFDMKENYRPNVYAESRFPLNLLINASLLDDNAKLFEEQKTIHSNRYQLIWKSRGVPEFYDVIEDPLQVKNLYSDENEKAVTLSKKLTDWSKTLKQISRASSEKNEISQKNNLELLERLRGIGYIK